MTGPAPVWVGPWESLVAYRCHGCGHTQPVRLWTASSRDVLGSAIAALDWVDNAPHADPDCGVALIPHVVWTRLGIRD